MKSHKLAWGIVIVVVLLACFGYLAYEKYEDVSPDQDLYQVVFLSNNDVFYGKLHKVFSAYPYLTDVYYLKQQPAETGTSTQTGPKYTVVKRGIDELFKPTDKMYIARHSVLFWENVGADSLVAGGIKADRNYRAELKDKEQEKPAEENKQ